MLTLCVHVIPVAIGTALLVLADVPAQTFVVDANNGPGTSFTSINAAAAAVPSGSVLIVRAGTYAGMSILGKAMTVVGEPGAVVTVGVQSPLVIANTSASQRVVVRDLTLQRTIGDATASIVCQSCQGPVLLERVARGPSSPPGPLRVVFCAQVSLSDCGLFQVYPFGTNVSVSGSHVVMQRCDSVTPLGTAVEVQNGSLQLVDCLVYGGNALTLDSASVRLPGGGAVSGAVTTSSTATIVNDPSVAIPPNAVAPGVTVVTRPQAFVSATGGAIGTTATATLRGAGGYLGVLFVGELGPRLSIPGVQFDAWLRAGTFVSAAAGVLGPPLSASIAVPANPALLGSAYCWQGATFDPSVGLELSNPAPFLP
jgi:hypothetical protein